MDAQTTSLRRSPRLVASGTNDLFIVNEKINLEKMNDVSDSVTEQLEIDI